MHIYVRCKNKEAIFFINIPWRKSYLPFSKIVSCFGRAINEFIFLSKHSYGRLKHSVKLRAPGIRKCHAKTLKIWAEAVKITIVPKVFRAHSKQSMILQINANKQKKKKDYFNKVICFSIK